MDGARARGGRPSLTTGPARVCRCPSPDSPRSGAHCESAWRSVSLHRGFCGRLKRITVPRTTPGFMDIKAVGIERAQAVASAFLSRFPACTQDVLRRSRLGMAAGQTVAENSWVWGGTTASPLDWAKPRRRSPTSRNGLQQHWDALVNDLECAVAECAEICGCAGNTVDEPLNSRPSQDRVANAMTAPARRLRSRRRSRKRELANAPAETQASDCAGRPAITLRRFTCSVGRYSVGRHLTRFADSGSSLAGGASPTTITVASSATSAVSCRRARKVAVARQRFVARSRNALEKVWADATTELESRYAEEVVAKCRVRVERHIRCRADHAPQRFWRCRLWRLATNSSWKSSTRSSTGCRTWAWRPAP